VKHVGFKPFYT